MQHDEHKKCVLLASGSPRRKELLAQLGISFQVAVTDVDESTMPDESPMAYVLRMAAAKAAAGYALVAKSGNTADDVIIGADTIVVLDGHIFGKPADQQDAERMHAQLPGRTHEVMSAVAVTDGKSTRDSVSTTQVSFRQLTPGESAAYWRTGEPCDKAGGYAIQGLGALFVENLQGSYTGVVGLPLFETAELLTAYGVVLGLENR